MIDTVQQVAFTFQYSAKRIKVFKEELKENIPAKGSMGKKNRSCRICAKHDGLHGPMHCLHLEHFLKL